MTDEIEKAVVERGLEEQFSRQYYEVSKELDRLQGIKEEIRDLMQKHMLDEGLKDVESEYGDFKLVNASKKVADDYAKAQLKAAKQVVAAQEKALIEDGNILVEEVHVLRFKMKKEEEK